MPKIIKIIFVLLSIVLVSALIIACTTVYNNDGDSKVDSSSPESSAVVSTEESSVDVSAESSVGESADISEDSREESFIDDSSEESSEEVSTAPVPTPPPTLSGGSEPITPPPAGISPSTSDVYFNDSLFVGHSVMVHFKNYVTSSRKTYNDFLGNATFGCSSAFSFFNNKNQTPEQADSVLPRYQGKGYKIEDLVTVTGAKTVYLGLMGLNDLGMFGKADTCARLAADEAIACIGRIKEKNPDVTVVVISSTYLTYHKSYAKLNNKNMSLLNNYVLDYCNENGIDFIDVATPLLDGNGDLATVYCSDDYCHLKNNAYHVWMNVLREYAEKKQSGAWVNPIVPTLD